MKIRFFLLLVVMLFADTTGKTLYGREWHLADGTSIGEGEVVKTSKTSALLELANGSSKNVSISDLCQEDQKYLTDRGQSRRPPKKPSRRPEAPSVQEAVPKSQAPIVPSAVPQPGENDVATAVSAAESSVPRSEPLTEIGSAGGFLPRSQSVQEFRVWIDVTGKFRVEAKLVRFDVGRVYLRKPDGATVEVPLEKLSRGDREHLAIQSIPRLKGAFPALLDEDLQRLKESGDYLSDEDGPHAGIAAEDGQLEQRRILGAAIAADFTDRTLLALLPDGVRKGQRHKVDAFQATRVVRESLEFVASLGFRGAATGAQTPDGRRDPVDWTSLRANDEQLRFQAASSGLQAQLAATVRIGLTMPYREGSEAATVFRAISEGRTAYVYKQSDGKSFALYSIDLDRHRRWHSVVAAGCDTDAKVIAVLRNQPAVNADASKSFPLIALSRNLQLEADHLSTLPTKLAADAANWRDQRSALLLADHLLSALGEIDANQFRGRDKTLAAVVPAVSAKAKASKIRVAEKDLALFVDLGLGSLGEVVRRKGFNGLGNFIDLNDPRHLFAVSNSSTTEIVNASE